jgi:hypothetical protein
MPVIPATQEGYTRGTWFKASLDKKLVGPYLKDKPSVVVHPHNPVTQEVEVGRLRFEISLGKISVRP